MWNEFPRVIYHTCDQSAFLSILENGLIPGGFPYKTGRAHNFFNSTPPWDAKMKKLQGTRAGRPIAIAFDTEMLMQSGVKLFSTDEAILSPDWISNMALIHAYDMRSLSIEPTLRTASNTRRLSKRPVKMQTQMMSS